MRFWPLLLLLAFLAPELTFAQDAPDIAGIPVDLVRLRDDMGNPIVNLEDDALRNQWYANILNDQAMIERIDMTQPEMAKWNLVPSCVKDGSKAFPPRRIVEVAQGFGANGVVQSSSRARRIKAEAGRGLRSSSRLSASTTCRSTNRGAPE